MEEHIKNLETCALELALPLITWVTWENTFNLVSICKYMKVITTFYLKLNFFENNIKEEYETTMT